MYVINCQRALFMTFFNEFITEVGRKRFVILPMLQTRPLYLTLVFFISAMALMGQSRLKGRVTDRSGSALSFASVYELGTTNGTLTNEEGYFELELKPGEHQLAFQYLGYGSQTRKISFPKDKEIQVSLLPENFQIAEVEIVAGEDPAMPIIRKAIELRDQNLKKTPAYRSELYIKALMKIVDAPESFLGQNLGSMDGILDSSRQGILYFSESLSRINFAPPKNYKEEMLSSKVSGDDRGISVNQFSYVNFNFYNENIQLFRELISPLSGSALQYYHYYLYEEFTDETGQKVYKIKVKPKSTFRPCFSGFIYINEGLFNINKLELKVSGDALKNPVVDTINIQQVFLPIGNDGYWPLFTQNIGFKVKVFTFTTQGNFNYIFKNYEINPPFKQGFFGSEVFAVSDSVIKNDTTYWTQNRPIPLTAEESMDYVKKDSIARVTSSPAYLDSIDRANNRFKLTDIFFGYNAGNSFKKIGYGFISPLTTFQFNAVEGTNFSLRPYFTKSNKDDYNQYQIKGEVRYGLADKTFKWTLDSKWNYNIKNQSYLRLSGGRDYLQYNEAGIISTLGNTFYSLLLKRNTAKLFDKKYVELGWGTELFNGVSAAVQVSVADRSGMSNNSQKSWLYENKKYEPNNPFNVDEEVFSFNDKIFKQALTIKIIPGQKFQTYPDHKVRITGGYPTIYLGYEKATPLADDFASFSKLKLTLLDHFVSANNLGYFSYRVEAATFLDKARVGLPDYFHFRGNHLVGGFRSPYMQTFKLQKGYQFSNTDAYLAGWFEHHMDGFINDKIPLLNKLGITGIYSCSALIKDGFSYVEPGVGIEGIKIGAIDIMRVDVFWSFVNGGYQETGLRLGFSTFFENIFGGE